jgi:hypothetical protein
VVGQTIMGTPGVSHPSPTAAEDFRRVLDGRAAQPVFQPVVELDNRRVLGYERWPGAGGLGSGVAGGAVRRALVAGDRGDGGPAGQRRFDVVVTHDRDLVIRAAAPLLRRLVPEP